MRAEWWMASALLALGGVSGCNSAQGGTNAGNAQTNAGAGGVLPVFDRAAAGSRVSVVGAGAAGQSGAAGAALAVSGSSAGRSAADSGGSGDGSGAQRPAAISGNGSAGMAGTPAAGAPSTGTLPAVSDLEKPGSFTPVTVSGTGPGNGYRLDHPKELGQAGVKHPVLLFAAGGGFPDNYATLLQYVVSHGFVVLSYAATDDQGKEIPAGLDWLVTQNRASSGLLAGKLDTEHAAAAGHSFGSLAVFNAASDPRITTTIHLQGGTLDPHSEVAKLRAPAEFICGESPTGDQDGTWTGDMSNPNCEIDFERATVPVFYGSLKGAAHIQLTEVVEDPHEPLRLRMLGAIGGWLRWRLSGDESQRARYVGSDCELCKPSTGWTIKQRGL